MSKKIILFILLISSIYAEIVQINKTTNYKEGIILAKEEKKPILLFVYSDFCPWCQRMKETTLLDPKVIKFINKNFIFICEKQNSTTLPDNFKTDFVPITYTISYKNGELLSELPGYKKADIYLELLEDTLFDE